MKIRSYRLKGFFLILMLFVIIAAGCIFAPFIFVDYEEQKVLVYTLLPGILVFLSLLVSTKPLFIIEYTDRLVLRYEFRSVAIWFDDVEYMECPYYEEPGNDMSRCIRIVYKSGDDTLIYDAYWGFSSFAGKWNKANSRTVAQDETGGMSKYVSIGRNYLLKPDYLRCAQTYKVVAVVLVLLFVAIKAITGTGVAALYPALAIFYCGCIWSKPFTSFYVSDGLLTSRNKLVGEANQTISLCDIKYVKMCRKHLRVVMKDGKMLNIVYALTEKQEREFSNYFKDSGIICRFELYETSAKLFL